MTYLYPANLRRGFLVAPFAGDSQQTVSRIFRERLNAQLTPLSAVRAATFFTEVSSDREARSVFAVKSGLRGLVWGNDRWLTISFPHERARPLQGTAVRQIPARYRELLIVPSIPAIGISRNPEEVTRYFLAALFSGILPRSTKEHSEEERKTLFEAQWTLLRDAGTIRAFWSTLAHQGYPWFLIGNRALEEALQGSQVERGYLKCALEAYRQASDFLRRDDNPELRAAILNNWGVALIVDGLLSGEAKRFKQGATQIRLALTTRRERDLFKVAREAADIAKLNARVLGLKVKFAAEKKGARSLKQKRNEGKKKTGVRRAKKRGQK